MKIEITEAQHSVSLYQSGISSRTALRVNEGSLPPTVTSLQVNELRFRDLNYTLIRAQLRTCTDLRLHFVKEGYCALICLEGGCHIGARSGSTELSPQHFLLQNQKEIQLKSREGTLDLLVIYFNPERLEGLSLLFNSPRVLLLSMSRILSEIRQCTEDCPIKCIFIESKILSLLYLVCQASLMSPPLAAENPADSSVERIKQAEQFIAKNLHKDYTLIDLAREVGLNDFKLKKGFKEMFGSTVSAYRHTLRMLRAKELLTEGLQVQQVSEEVGYKHAHHFSAAFKAYFNQSPSRVMQRENG